LIERRADDAIALQFDVVVEDVEQIRGEVERRPPDGDVLRQPKIEVPHVREPDVIDLRHQQDVVAAVEAQ